MISCPASSPLHACDLLRGRQAYRMPVRPAACALSKLYVRQIRCPSDSGLNDSQLPCGCFCFRSPVEISYLSPLLGMRLIRSRILVTEDSYEYHEGSLLAAESRTDWIFRLDVLDTVYGGDNCIEECQDRIWPIYSFTLLHPW